MRHRLAFLLAAVAAAALLAGLAQAAKPVTTLKVRACQTGDKPKQRLVTFYGRMRAVPGTRRMKMRFKLIDRSNEPATLVAAPPKLARWHRSRPGVQAFGFSQRVRRLTAGRTYAARVDFRWLDGRGHAIKKLRRRSGNCRQDGGLPNLAVTRLTAKPGDAAGTERYEVAVRNRGRVAARSTQVDLIVDGSAADAAPIDLIAPGETKTVKIDGPACRHRVRAVVDRAGAIPETTEGDNSLRTRCPAMARRTSRRAP